LLQEGTLMSEANRASESRLRLLIVSVGSLVGQNILDSLEFPAFNRRGLVEVFGTNSVAMSANNFRCDRCFLVPPTASADYADAMRRVLREARPELVLTARDADTAALWHVIHGDPSLPGKLPYGNLETILYALNKWQSYLFCRKHGLPVAETFAVGAAAGEPELRRFVDDVGFPLIAKPTEGFASKGVFFVRNWSEALRFLHRKDYILQEYLGNPGAMDDYFALLEGPTPLFSEAPNVNHHTCHVPIAPSGRIGEIFVLRNHHNFGAVTKMQRVEHPDLEGMARKFGEAFVSEGGCGPLSVQFRLDRNGRPKAQEMNLRTTGSTFARLMMGQDEIGYIVRDLLPGRNFPVYVHPGPAYGQVVLKSLYSWSVSLNDADSLARTGRWDG
jgi:carbamoyl-phosphate synthase large subunit